MILKRVDALSCGKVLGILYAFIGLLGGIMFTLIGVFGAAVGMAQGEAGALFGALFGVGAVIILPLLYGAMGFIGGMLSAFLYNLVASFVGGIELDLEPRPGSTAGSAAAVTR